MVEPRQYFPTLDGWRAIAVLSIILFHGRYEFFPSHPWLIKLAWRGYSGVELFFAISGFLITRLLLDELDQRGTISLSQFYWKRLFRILPPYYVVLATTAALSITGLIDLKRFEIPCSFLFLRNFYPLGPGLDGGVYTAHFWSLAVEEHFYLVWPLLLKWQRGHVARIALVSAFAAMLWRSQHPAIMAESWTDGLFLGAVAAAMWPSIIAWSNRIRITNLWIPVMLLTLAVLIPSQNITGLSLMFPLLILSTVLRPASLLGRLLEWAPLRLIGKLSYSLYLWQELFCATHSPALKWVQAPPLNVLALLLAASASYLLIERPMMRWSRRNMPQWGIKKTAHVLFPTADINHERRYGDAAVTD